MDIRMQGRAITLLYRLFLRGSTSAHQIPFIPSKTVLPLPSDGDTPLVSPEACGIPSDLVTEVLTALERERDAVVHTVGMARDGRTFSLAAAPGYHVTTRHQTHSLCKTVTGLAIGILVDEGRLALDTPAYRLVGAGLPPLLSPRMKAITVRHLLTMTAGVNFGEVGAVTEEDWVRCFFESAVSFPPGSAFYYNSMNSYILSVIVEQITGVTLGQFAAERIFAPLGIKETLWEICPRGHTKGGWGLYLSIEDMLKLGELIMNGGTYGGVRILSREWMRAMVKPHIKTPDSMGEYDYGYHIWVKHDRSAFLANGMLGQNIWIVPKNRLVVAMNAANTELFSTGPMLSCIADRLAAPLDKTSKKPDRRALRALREREAAFFTGRTWTHEQDPDIPMRDGHLPAALWQELSGEAYLCERNNVGLLPMFIMLTQNNLSAGIVSLTLLEEDGERALLIEEGEETYRIPIAFGRFAHTEITVRGECFRLAARAEFCDDTNGEPILKVELLFPEMASARRIRLYYDKREPTLVLSEVPGRRIMDSFLMLFDFIPYGKLLGGIIRPQLEKELVAYRIRMAYEPTLRLGRKTAPEDHEFPILDREAPILPTEKKRQGKPTAARKTAVPPKK